MRYARATFAGATLLIAVSAVPAHADHMRLMGTEDRGWQTVNWTPSEVTPEPRLPPSASESTIGPNAPPPPAFPPVPAVPPGAAVPPASSGTLDIDIKVGQDVFRLGARFLGAAGVWGAWLNGQSRKDGFTLDGRLQQPDGGYNFRLNADVDGWAKQALDQLLKP